MKQRQTRKLRGALLALATKGETVEELAGLATGLRAKSVRLKCKHKCFIDTAGQVERGKDIQHLHGCSFCDCRIRFASCQTWKPGRQ